jgi:hypothetical protein
MSCMIRVQDNFHLFTLQCARFDKQECTPEGKANKVHYCSLYRNIFINVFLQLFIKQTFSRVEL